MEKRNLFGELMEGVEALKAEREGKITMTTKPASQDSIDAAWKAAAHYKKSSEDNKKSASVWHKEATYYAKELTTYRMLAAIFCATSIISIVLLISK
jgi:hypothetical protein